MKYFLAIIIGYLIGCFSTGHMVSRLKQIDIRHTGTGNPGASNITFILGWKMGVLVAFVDISKGIIATLGAILFTGDKVVGIYAGCACILGHMYPFYLKFRGGKGFATMIGVLIGFDFPFAVLATCFIFLITWVTDYIVLSTLTITILFLLRVLEYPGGIYALPILAPVILIIFFKHRSNLYRIFVGRQGEKGFSLLFKKKH